MNFVPAETDDCARDGQEARPAAAAASTAHPRQLVLARTVHDDGVAPLGHVCIVAAGDQCRRVGACGEALPSRSAASLPELRQAPCHLVRRCCTTRCTFCCRSADSAAGDNDAVLYRLQDLLQALLRPRTSSRVITQSTRLHHTRSHRLARRSRHTKDTQHIVCF